MNKVIITGNLTEDPSMVFTPQGKGIAEFSLGLNRRFTTANGEKGEEVSFVQCKAFGRTGEIAVEFLRKGDLAGVEGRLRQESWKNAEGQGRSKLVIVVEQLELMPNKHRNHPDDGSDAGNEVAGEAAAPRGGRRQRQTAKAA